jgi:YHS domain-containing protein
VIRLVLVLLIAVVVITLLKGVIGIIMKGFSALFVPEPRESKMRRTVDRVPLSGELKKDPVCGTYVGAATSLRESIDGVTVHFCSAECRDKYVASIAR